MKKDPSSDEQENVLVFGYSDNPERYSYIAYNLLKEYNHKVMTFNPHTDNLALLPKNFDTLTLYVGPAVSDKFQDLLLNLEIKRVIFNPGTENPSLEKKWISKGIEVVRGCTLVMLKTNQF
jgi:predicted CoA-binding protein